MQFYGITETECNWQKVLPVLNLPAAAGLCHPPLQCDFCFLLCQHQQAAVWHSCTVASENTSDRCRCVLYRQKELCPSDFYHMFASPRLRVFRNLSIKTQKIKSCWNIHDEERKKKTTKKPKPHNRVPCHPWSWQQELQKGLVFLCASCPQGAELHWTLKCFPNTHSGMEQLDDGTGVFKTGTFHSLPRHHMNTSYPACFNTPREALVQQQPCPALTRWHLISWVADYTRCLQSYKISLWFSFL